MAYGYSALRQKTRPMPDDPLIEDEYGAIEESPLRVADNSTTVNAIQQQNEMREAARRAAEIEAQRRAIQAPPPQPTGLAPAGAQQPYVSPFGTKPLTDEEYRALPKAAPRSALDLPILAQATPELLGDGAAARAGSALRAGSVRSRMDAAEDAALGGEAPSLPAPTIPAPGLPPKPSFFDRLFKPKPKAQPLQYGSLTTGIRG